MSRLLLIIFVSCIHFISIGQIGFSAPIFRGPDKDIIASNWGLIAEGSVPIIRTINRRDTSKWLGIVFQPSFKHETINFKNNLIVEKNNGQITFTPDSDLSHIYKKGFLKTSSMMQINSFYMPIEVWLIHQKLPNIQFSPSIYVEYIVGGQFKRKFSTTTGQEKIKTKFRSDSDYFGLNRFQFGLCAHISYKFLTVYGVYSLQPIFKPDQNINVSRYNFGVWINFFYKRWRLKPY